MKSTQSEGFAIKRATLTEKRVSYDTFRVTCWLNGLRVRKKFKSREEALGERNRLEVRSCLRLRNRSLRGTRVPPHCR